MDDERPCRSKMIKWHWKVNGRLMRVERMTGFAGSGFSL
jgi:hypothetical protein